MSRASSGSWTIPSATAYARRWCRVTSSRKAAASPRRASSTSFLSSGSKPGSVVRSQDERRPAGPIIQGRRGRKPAKNVGEYRRKDSGQKDGGQRLRLWGE